MPFCLLVHHKAPHRNWMPEPKYLHLYENAEFPYPDTFDDDYNTRCRPANEQEMQIDKDMTIVYDLKLNQLKDTSPYNKEWNVKGMQASINRMNVEERGQWEAAYEKRYADFMKKKAAGADMKNGNIRNISKIIFGVLNLLTMKSDVCWSIWKHMI